MCLLYNLWLYPNYSHNFNLTVGIIIQARANTNFLICTSEMNQKVRNFSNELHELVQYLFIFENINFENLERIIQITI